MFNRRNFAQIVASLVPLPFLKINTPEILTDPENIENLPVVQFESILNDHACYYAPRLEQFDKEFKELIAEAKNENKRYYSKGMYLHAWVEKKNMIQNHLVQSSNITGYWGKVEVFLYLTNKSPLLGVSMYDKHISLKYTEGSIVVTRPINRSWQSKRITKS